MPTLKKRPAVLILSSVIFVQLCLLIASGGLRGIYVGSYDGLGYYAWVRSIVIDQDIDFHNEFKMYNPLGKAPDPDIKYPKTGNTFNIYGLGLPILCAPGFIVGFILDKIFFGHTNGYGACAQLGYILNSFFYYALGLVLFYLFLAKRCHWKQALAAALFIAFGTTTGFYAWSEPYYSTIIEFFFVVLILKWLFSNSAMTKQHIFLGSILFGFAYWVRMDLLIFLLPAGIKILKNKKTIKNGLMFSSICLAIILCHCYMRYLLSGDFNIVGGYSSKVAESLGGIFDITDPNCGLVLFSPNNGLLFWCPLFIFALLALRKFWQDVSKSLVLIILFKICLISTWVGWDGSGSMGPRLLNSLVPLLVWSFCITNNEFVKKYYLTFVILSCVWFQGLVYQRFTKQMPYYEGRGHSFIDQPYKRVFINQFKSAYTLLVNPKQAFKDIRN